MKPPNDLQLICDDLKVCGRREYGILIRMRHKFQMLLARALKAHEDAAKKRKELEGGEPPSEDEDAKIDRELEETMKRMEKEKKRAAKKEKIAADKSELRKKMSVIATTTLNNDEDLMMPRKLWDKLHQKGFEAIEENSEDDDDADGQSDESDDSDQDSDEDASENSNADEDESNSDSDSMDEK